MAFNINDYETVEVRLGKFIAEYPDFRIYTELLESSPTRFIVRASIYRTELDANPWATGLAYEVVTDRGVNSTSALENAETSAIGRSLANAGYAAKGKRPSQSEMAKVIAAESQPKTIYGRPNSRSAAVEQALRTLSDAGFSLDYVNNFKIVLWNLQSMAYGGAGNKFETYGNVDNVYYFSGFDGSIISFLTGVEGQKPGTEPKNAEELFQVAMSQEIMQMIQV